MSDKRPILVTGASGLIGRRVVEMLAVVGRATLATDRLRAVDEAVKLDLADLTDAAALDRLVVPNLSGIIHCGAISGPMLIDPVSVCLVIWSCRVDDMPALKAIVCASFFSGNRPFPFSSSLSAPSTPTRFVIVLLCSLCIPKS
jgi:uncharacterized protein YbjT (DUF2867 family)